MLAANFLEPPYCYLPLCLGPICRLFGFFSPLTLFVALASWYLRPSPYLSARSLYSRRPPCTTVPCYTSNPNCNASLRLVLTILVLRILNVPNQSCVDT
ncbi:hypothetical protein JAAARDRAFT_204699 [Jaapia argillacea MUCL 33604]|uniref:Uncharacterized protein n=1 Tax=Jaapia argillacea MUCL 33604 TaxID=933084 RepID=A0A067Q1G2_9AGAM|nr:hypothetical protein JAAARDRAFT_204699 [Jaapia argillacea MUCL 33604]